MEDPIKMDDLGIPLFLETPRWLQDDPFHFGAGLAVSAYFQRQVNLGPSDPPLIHLVFVVGCLAIAHILAAGISGVFIHQVLQPDGFSGTKNHSVFFRLHSPS